MNIIIAGAGRVGYNLAKTLSRNHDVVVIDNNRSALNSISESIDVLPVYGDIKDPSIYSKLLDGEVDFFVAVTNSDEANLISLVIAKDILNVKNSLIRLKNKLLATDSLKEKFGIDEPIFPLELTSQTIKNLLKYPKANNVKRFKFTDKELISIKVAKISGPVEIFPKGYEVVGVERDKKFFIPAEDKTIYPGDLIYLFGDKIAIHHFCKEYAQDYPSDNENIAVFGADDMGIEIAKMLLEQDKSVKIIEKDIQKCKIAEELLGGRATILNSKYSTSHLYEEEGLKHADIVIAASKNDEYNIIECLEAKDNGVKKVISINSDLEHYSLMHSLGLVVVRGPKIGVVNAILERINSSDVAIKRIFCGGRGIVYMRKIYPESKLIGLHIKVLKFRDNLLTYLIRNGEIIHCEDSIVCEEGDVIALFCDEESEDEAKRWLESV